MEKMITCNTAIAGNGELFPANNDVVVICPMDCDLFNGPVYGDGMYHSNSSVCKAALHYGVVSKKGGKIHVRISSPQKEYKQSKKNNITSNEYLINDGLPSFSLQKYVPNCPLDYFKNDPNYNTTEEDEDEKETSFLQKNELVRMKDKYFSFVQKGQNSLPDLAKLSKAAMKTANQALSNGVNTVKDLARNAAGQANDIKNKIGEYLDDSRDKVNDATNNALGTINTGINNLVGAETDSADPMTAAQAIQIAAAKQAAQAAQAAGISTGIGNNFNPESQTTAEMDKIKQTSNKCTPNTDLGKKILRSRREQSDWEYFAEIKKENKVILAAIENFKQLLAWSKKASRISNYRIRLLYVKVERFRSKILKYIKKIYSKAMGRIYRTRNIFRMFEEEFYKLCERDDYILNYNLKEELFKQELIVFDFLNSQNLKSDVNFRLILVGYFNS
jgi:hypothetical protein